MSPITSSLAILISTLAPLNARKQGDIAQPHNFRLTSTTLSAIEGGPVVIACTVKYFGRIPIKIEGGLGEPTVLVTNGGRRVASFIDKRKQAWNQNNATLMASDSILVITPVHRNYRDIRAGKQTFNVKWTLFTELILPDIGTTRRRTFDPNDWSCAPKELQRRAVTELEQSLEVDVLPPTRENLLACNRMLHSYLDAARSLDDYDTVLQHVLYNPRKELSDVSARLLDCEQLYRYHYEIARGMLQSESKESAGIASLVKYLSATDPKAVVPVLDVLTWEVTRESMLTKETITALQSTPSIWPRVMINILVPNALGPVWRWQLMQQVKLLKHPIPLEQLEWDIKQLNHDRFAIRSKAKVSLIRRGEMALPALRDILSKKGVPLESQQNVQSVMFAIQHSRPDTLEQQMMKCLAACLLHNKYGDFVKEDRVVCLRQVRDTIQAIAQNHADAWITQEAKRILNEYEMQKGQR